MILAIMDSVDKQRGRSPTSSPAAVAHRPDGRLDLWVCTRCGYTYDGEAGEPVTQTPAQTPFEVLPDDWRCPHCTAEKSHFFH